MYSTPVRCDSFHGIGELKGVLRFDDDRLSLQYQIADTIRGDFRAPPAELELPLESLVDAVYRSGFLWMAPNIELRVSDFRTIAALPAEVAGRLRLNVPRSDRRDARKIVDATNGLLADLRFQRLNASIDRMTRASPTHPLAADRKVDPPTPGQRE